MEPHSRVRLGRDVYIAPTAYVGGDVTLGDECTVMHHAVIRGDFAAIRLGDRCNVQDGAILHTGDDVLLILGDEVSVGHRAVVHGHRIGSGVLIGIGAAILDGCEVGDGCMIAAGAILAPETVVPANMVVMGIPARVVREVTDADRRYIRRAIESYLAMGRRHKSGQFPNVVSGGLE